MITVSQLAEPEIGAPQNQMRCNNCSSVFSADAGDYFMMAPDDVLFCACGSDDLVLE